MRYLMTILSFALFLSVGHATASDLIELNDASDLEELIQESTVPVAVAFTAYWCNPCQKLKSTLADVAPEYPDVVVAFVDAHKNPELRKYLQGGYPTVRSWFEGEILMHSFTGSKSARDVRRYLDQLMAITRR